MPDSLVAVLTPHGALRVERGVSEFPLDEVVALRLDAAFARGGGHGLLQLGLAEAGSRLPPDLAFWRAFAMQLWNSFVRWSCQMKSGLVFLAREHRYCRPSNE